MDYSYYLPTPPLGAQMLQGNEYHNQAHMSFRTNRSSFNDRPLSEATEIFDTDYEAEYSESESPRRSVESFGNDSSTTLSIPDELPTPGGYDPLSYHLYVRNDKPVQGPSGPHLFRGSFDGSAIGKSEGTEWPLAFSPVALDNASSPVWVPQERRASEPNYSPGIRRAPSKASSRSSPKSSSEQSFVRSWTPAQVAEWMYETGVEDGLVESFIRNDISGAVLLDLQLDDLKELDIQSFGKRHLLMNIIDDLRNSDITQPEIAMVESSMSMKPSPLQDGGDCIQSPDSDRAPRVSQRRRRRNRVINEQDIISPAESVSIVAIEQLIPKPHSCSKGENCAKYQKRQRKLARIAREFPTEFSHLNGQLIATNSPGPLPTPAITERSLRSNNSPSVVASSDVLGPGQFSELRLNAENLNGVKPRDPQENVRQFLSFQHLHDPSKTEPAPLQMFPPLSSPETMPPKQHMTNQLRALPKLQIPGQSSSQDPFSPLRTVTPSMGARMMGSATATQEFNPYAFEDNTYRQGTPFSEMDVPVTALPVEPLARENSQSVPPNMRFGNLIPPQYVDPINRSRSTRPDHRRRPSFSTMAPLEENEIYSPIKYPSDMDNVQDRRPHQAYTASNSISHPQLVDHSDSSSSESAQTDPDVTHSGWMKKRKTRLLRHEWQDAHFTLKGTTLAMHKDEEEARRRSALETIDVDDYAVACSSIATNSKLTAAFKRSVLRKAANVSNGGTFGKGMDETAFAFSLVPASNTAERRPLFAPSGKNHHFAVKTRDERINWMRELMLAKALKQGKQDGNEIRMNGRLM
ncbi:hypothetical protein FQN57_003008 [Myotisia sp. PD_48]|nr:hypothetical protein FQN57_003008 [Myotisia sp. PD_48]